MKAPIVSLLAAFVAAGCSAPIDVAQSEDFATDVNDNTDVQVVSAESRRGMFFGVMDQRFDVDACHFFDLEETPWSDETTHTGAADCTDMVAEGLGAPMLNQYIEPQIWLRGSNDTLFRHWCSEIDVTIAIKKAAFDADSFEGIGFYAHDHVLNADDDRRWTFYEKDDPRLAMVGEAELQTGDAVYLFRFAGGGPCDTHGSGNAPYNTSISFKPYVRYAGGYERWEAVEENHRVYFMQRWDRSADLLR